MARKTTNTPAQPTAKPTPANQPDAGLLPPEQPTKPLQTPAPTDVQFDDDGSDPIDWTADKELPEVTILVCTYNREENLLETLDRLAQFIFYPKDKLHWLICDDSSPAPYAMRIKRAPIFKELNAELVTTPTNSGWAANVNNGLAHVQTEYVFFIEDDYYATEPINLAAGIALMQTKPDVGMVRYRGIAGSHVVTHLFETDVKEYLPHYREGMGVVGKLNYMQLDSGSPTVHIYSNGPHLKHWRFHQFYGFYPTGFRLGETEEKYAHTVKDMMKLEGAPAIVILPEDVVMNFDHVGESYQNTDADQPH